MASNLASGDEQARPVTIKLSIEQVNTIKESFIVQLTNSNLHTLKINENDAVLLKGRKKTDTVCRVQVSTSMRDEYVRMNEITRKNLRARNGAAIFIRKVTVPKGETVWLSPICDTLRSFPANLVDTYLKWYFNGQPSKPIHLWDQIVVARPGYDTAKFQVVRMDPSPYCLVTCNTKLYLTPAMTELNYLQYLKAVGYDDIGGYKREVKLLREVIEIPLSNPEIFIEIGIKPPRGVLLYGPPGTGKTLLARAASNESGGTFLIVNGPEILSSYFGGSEATLRMIFNKANACAPSIIFFDEFDAIAERRDRVGLGVEKRIVAQLLTLMDGLVENSRVIVIAATNRPDCIDPALRRAGRFDREIEIGIPNADERLEILRIITKDMKISNDVDLNRIAKETHGLVGADLSLICTEAALKQISDKFVDVDLQGDIEDLKGSLTLTMNDFLHAMKKVPPSALKDAVVERPNIKWEDIGGLDAVKREIQELIQYPIQYPEKFSEAGLEPSKGILFYGPPGCGKTMLAQAICGEAEVNFISIKGPELLSKWFGESCLNVRELFCKARRAAPCLLFFDEIDSIAKVRGKDIGCGEADRVVDQLLTEIQGIVPNSNVYVVGATNRPDILDAAFLRPGRFDQTIYIPLPDEESRLSILSAKLRKSPLDKDVDLKSIARRTSEFSGADLTELCQRAAKLAIQKAIEDDKRASMLDKEATQKSPVLLTRKHFERALLGIHRSVSDDDIRKYEEYAQSFHKSTDLHPKAKKSSPGYGYL